MKRRASALIFVAALALTGCDSEPTYDFAEPVDQSGNQGQQQPHSQGLSDALSSIDCQGQQPASFEAAGLVQAGECVPFAGVETIEFYEFEDASAAEAWADTAQVGDVDGIYLDGAVVIIDRQNDYLLQLGAQFEPAR